MTGEDKKKRKQEEDEAVAILSGIDKKKGFEGNVERTAGSSKEEEKESKEEQQAAVWLTGGLEQEIFSGNVVAPSLQINPVSSLEEVASGPQRKKDEEKKEVRPYETRAKGIYETNREEVYEETAENLFGRIVRPRDMNELRQDIPRVRMPVATELMGTNEAKDLVKYVENKQDNSGLSFLKKDKKEDVKYKKSW